MASIQEPAERKSRVFPEQNSLAPSNRRHHTAMSAPPSVTLYLIHRKSEEDEIIAASSIFDPVFDKSHRLRSKDTRVMTQ